MKRNNKIIPVFIAVFVGGSVLAFSKVLPDLDFSFKPVAVEAVTDLETYYKKVNGSGTALMTSVRSTISSGYKSIGYKGLYDAYEDTDTRADGKLRDLYSDNTQFTHGNKQCGNYSSIGDCYNREHTIPQSWWGGGTSNQGCDIYIVWPSDGKINGMRSNYPFGETTSGTRYALSGDPAGNRLGSSTSTQYVTGTVFEPFDDRKGDMARTYFYAVTRWSGASGWDDTENARKVFSTSGNNGFVQKYLDMLLKWHKLDPVDDFEIARNNGGQKHQGNRNPFVDHPSWVDLIWGGKYEGKNAEDTKSGTVVDGKLDGGSTDVHLTSLLCENQTDSYYVGDEFVVDGTFTALYSSGYSEVVTPTLVNSPNMDVVGTPTVTFSYTDGDDTATYELVISVTERPSIDPVELVLSDVETEYTVGDEFVKPAVELMFTDGHLEDYTNKAVFTGIDLSEACEEQLITVSVAYDDETFSSSYTITVKEAQPEPGPEPGPVVLSSITLSDVKTEYYVGDTFMRPTVTAHYSDDNTEDVTDAAVITGYDLFIAMTQTVTVSYTKDLVTKIETYQITVTAPTPVVVVTPINIDISGDIKSVYNVGDELVKPTIIVTYSDDSTADVTEEATFSGFDSSMAGSYTITVSYTEDDTTLATSYRVRVDAPAAPSGCSGNIEATCIILSTLSLLGIALILINKRKARV